MIALLDDKKHLILRCFFIEFPAKLVFIHPVLEGGGKPLWFDKLIAIGFFNLGVL